MKNIYKLYVMEINKIESLIFFNTPIQDTTMYCIVQDILLTISKLLN